MAGQREGWGLAGLGMAGDCQQRGACIAHRHIQAGCPVGRETGGLSARALLRLQGHVLHFDHGTRKPRWLSSAHPSRSVPHAALYLGRLPCRDCVTGLPHFRSGSANGTCQKQTGGRERREAGGFSFAPLLPGWSLPSSPPCHFQPSW